MTFTPHRAATIIALALLATVATQIFYVGVVGPADDEVLRRITWVSEVGLYSIVTLAALPLIARETTPLVWSAVAVSGLVNVLQLGIGLAEFGPAGEAGDPKVMASVLGGAFFLYFHGKAMIGVAAMGAGLGVFVGGTGWRKALGLLAILAGLAALTLNLFGIAAGMAWVMPAGASGTAATAALACIILSAKDSG